jgi:tetratricopeptide (TPR) repeat protein
VPICALLLFIGTTTLGQFTAAGQADSPEEFDMYLQVLSKTTPKEVISSAGDFERLWPHSELLPHVFELELEACRSLGDSEKAILAGKKALDVAPDNLVVLANLGYIIASSTTDSQQLDCAERYARRELEVSKTIRLPKRISPGEWDEIQGRLGSTAHATLGLVSFKRGKMVEAVQEFETAIKLTPVPEPAQIYRLGILHRANGNLSRATELLHQAAESDDPTIRELAERELKSLRR